MLLNITLLTRKDLQHKNLKNYETFAIEDILI